MPTPETPPLGERLKQLQENVQKCLEARDRGVPETQWGLQAVSVLQEAREIKELLHGEGEREMATILDTIRRNFGEILTEEVGKTPRSPTPPPLRESTTAHELNEAYFTQENVDADLHAFATAAGCSNVWGMYVNDLRRESCRADLRSGAKNVSGKEYLLHAAETFGCLTKRSNPSLGEALKILKRIAKGKPAQPEPKPKQPKPSDETPPGPRPLEPLLDPQPPKTTPPKPVAPPSPKPPEPAPVAPPVPVPAPAPHPSPLPRGEGTGPEPAPEAAPEKADLSRYIEAILQSGEREAFLERLKGPSGRLWIDKKSADGKPIRIWLSLTPEDVQKLENGEFGTGETANKPLPFRFRIDDLSAGNSWKEQWNGKKAAISALVLQLSKAKKSENRGLCEEIAQKLGIVDAQKTAFSDRLFGYLTPDGAEKDMWTHVRNAYWHMDGWDTADQAKGKLTALGVTAPFTLPPYKETKVKTWEKIDARSSALLTPQGQYIVRMQGKDAAKYPLAERQETDGTTSYHFAGLGWVRGEDLRICEKKERQPDGSWKPVDPATFELMAWKVTTTPPTPSAPPAVPPATPSPASPPDGSKPSPKGPTAPPAPKTPADSPAGKGGGPDAAPPGEGAKTPPPLGGKGPDGKVSAEKITISDVPATEAKAIVQGASIRGSSFLGKRLDNSILAEQQLSPRRQVRIGDTTIAFSDPYNIDDGRIAVMAYVRQNGSWVARSFYRSNSQSVWRYLPNYTEDGGIIEWYGKGHSEASIGAPIACQKVLADMSKTGTKILQLKNINSDVVFAGTARRTGDTNTYLAEVRPKSRTLEGNLYPSKGEKIPPEDVTLGKKEEEPNFTNLLDTWTQQSGLYGETRVEVFASNDKSLLYMFCSDAKGRAWIGGMEYQKSPMTSVGVRQEWIDGGDLTTPAFEYKSQTRGFGNAKLQSGNYVDMFEKYLRKIPIIKTYIASLKKRGKYKKS